MKKETKEVHFEDIWNEAESLTEGSSSFDNVRAALMVLETTGDDKGEQFGKLLFQIAHLSKDLNINVAAALLHEINNVKIDEYE